MSTAWHQHIEFPWYQSQHFSFARSKAYTNLYRLNDHPAIKWTKAILVAEFVEIKMEVLNAGSLRFRRAISAALSALNTLLV